MQKPLLSLPAHGQTLHINYKWVLEKCFKGKRDASAINQWKYERANVKPIKQMANIIRSRIKSIRVSNDMMPIM